MKDGGTSAASGWHLTRAQSVLVVAEIVLALVLLVGAGLLIRTFIAVREVDRGPDYLDEPRYIVGVVDDLRDDADNLQPQPTVYVPLAQVSDRMTMRVNKLFPLAAVGVVIGVGAALLLTRLMVNLVFGVRVYDLQVFGSVVTLLAGVALVAAYISARRATRVNPLDALRSG